MSAAARIIEKRYGFSTNVAMAVLLLVVAIGAVVVGSLGPPVEDDGVAIEPSPASMF